jgi:hypothetical protein
LDPREADVRRGALNTQPAGNTAALPESQPPVIIPPLLSPPELEPTQQPGAVRQIFAMLLSFFLGLFLADAVVSLADDSLILWFGVHVLTVVRGLVSFFALMMALVIYGLMGITPMVPKRLFLPVALFNPVGALFSIPLAIYFYGRLEQVGWAISFCQLLVGASILCWVLGGIKLRWPLVRQSQLGSRGFSWLNLSGFLLVNAFILLPAVVVYLVVCAALAVDHFSEGFLALRPSGLAVQVRRYVRNDGKTVQLVPMAHVGEADFYRKLSQSFPTNSLVLMEGVTDENNLLTNKITYKRMASTLGLAEQHEEFNPVRVQMVMADVDIKEFTPETIGFLNLAMLLHAKGLTAETLLTMLRFPPPPHSEERLWDDLIHKRNHHLLDQLQAHLADSEQIIVPWGVAHMPGIAKGIQASGFRLDATQEYTVVRFRLTGSKSQSPRKAGVYEKPR